MTAQEDSWRQWLAAQAAKVVVGPPPEPDAAVFRGVVVLRESPRALLCFGDPAWVGHESVWLRGGRTKRTERGQVWIPRSTILPTGMGWQWKVGQRGAMAVLYWTAKQHGWVR